MKALSIRQPWAWLICEGRKNIENRAWHTDYRGPLLIHASMKWDKAGYEFIQNSVANYWERQVLPRKEGYVFGTIIGVVTMADCVDHHPSKWFFGPWGFVFEASEMWADPIPYRGRLNIFDVPDSIFAGLPIS